MKPVLTENINEKIRGGELGAFAMHGFLKVCLVWRDLHQDLKRTLVMLMKC